jgi:hypothetical protein
MANARFPFEVVETSGEDALATWESLKTAGRGAPVVLGSKIEDYLPALDPMLAVRLPPVHDILAQAASISFPDDLRRFWREQLMAVAGKAMPSMTGELEWDEPPLGDWPDETSDGSLPDAALPGLAVVYDFTTRSFRPRVQIALIPTDDPTTIPAHLHWGAWNDCPPPAYHVAALRSWRDRYGAELVGMDGDLLNLRVSRRPVSREEAVEVALEQPLYCSDNIYQGLGTVRPQAAELMRRDWWYFWWD